MPSSGEYEYRSGAHPAGARVTDEEIERLALAISLKVWAKVRRYVRKQQRELHDLLDTEE